MTVWTSIFTFFGGIAGMIIFFVVASFLSEATPKVWASLKHRLHWR